MKNIGQGTVGPRWKEHIVNASKMAYLSVILSKNPLGYYTITFENGAV